LFNGELDVGTKSITSLNSYNVDNSTPLKLVIRWVFEECSHICSTNKKLAQQCTLTQY